MNVTRLTVKKLLSSQLLDFNNEQLYVNTKYISRPSCIAVLMCESQGIPVAIKDPVQVRQGAIMREACVRDVSYQPNQ